MMNSQSEVDKEPIIGDDRKNNWEEDAVGSMWPPRPYSCTFCKREFRSAQALGGHMNIHRRDRARLKQNLNPHHHNYQLFYLHHLHHHQNHHTMKSLLGNSNHRFSAPVFSTQINCGITHAHNYSTQATTISTIRSLSQENKFSPSSSSSFILGQMGSPNSEQAMECGNFVETSLSVGVATMFGKNSSPCGDRPNMSCKRLKNSISSLPVFLRPCSKDKGLAFQPVEISLGLHHRMEDLDLELRLGKQQKVE